MYASQARWAYLTALHLYTSGAEGDAATKASDELVRAFALNRLVPAYFTGAKSIDGAMPATTGHAGDVEEAVSIASSLFDIWQLVPGAVVWCASLWSQHSSRIESEHHASKLAATAAKA